MRPINRIILHCSASLEGIDLRASDIRAYHTNPVSQGGRGWKNPGYHYVVRLDGTIEKLLDEKYVSNGVKGYNANSIHICYVGGLKRVNNGHSVEAVNNGHSGEAINNDHSGEAVNNGHSVRTVPANTMTPAQREAIVNLLHDLRIRYPTATLHGHNEFAAKACPCFDVRAEFPEFA